MINAGIIGCGNIAWKWDKPRGEHFNTHAKAYYHNSKVNLKACCDVVLQNAKGLAGQYHGVVPYSDYKEMLKKEKLDIVSVSVSTPSHFEALKYILTETGVRYILAEKPLTMRLADTKKILELAKKKKAYISINYIRRFDLTMNKLKGMMASGDFGRFLFGSFIYYGGFKNNGIHFIDFLNYLGFEYDFIRFTGKVKKLKGDFSASFLAESRNSGPIYFNCIPDKFFSCLNADFVYEKARIRIGDYGDVEIFRPEKALDFPAFSEFRLKKTMPSTILTVMKHSVGHIVRQFQKGIINYEPLEQEIKLMNFLRNMERRLGK